VLPSEDHPNPRPQLYEAYTRVRTLLALDERDAAQGWLNRIYLIVREHDLDTAGADALAASF
jgi:hypothetical protein